jgi:hypothetical protein
MSVPMGAWLFGRLVSIGYSPVEVVSALVKVQAIVVLDGGARRSAYRFFASLHA